MLKFSGPVNKTDFKLRRRIRKSGERLNSVFFFYTLAILLVCIVTAAVSLTAWASSRRRFFQYGCAAFVCYAIEITEIFFYEYLQQNRTFSLDNYYVVTMPVTRTLVVCALNAFLWLMVLDVLDRHSKKLFLVPLGVFLAANAAVLGLMPSSPFQQFAYYTLRQVFLLFMLGFIVYARSTSPDPEFRARVERFKKPLIIAFAIVVCIVLEDVYVILLAPASAVPSMLLLYLSERNISENVFVCYFAYLLCRYALHTLSIRMKEAPQVDEVSDLERHIDELMPFYRERYRLSEREGEVLHLVVMGKSNQEIAAELYLAVGTVKTHVHNILVKTGQKSREALVLHFWQN